MAEFVYQNDVFDDENDNIHNHPDFVKLEAALKEAEQQLEYHKNLCAQLQKVAIKANHDRETTHEDGGGVKQEGVAEEAPPTKAGGKKKKSKTKVDMYVEEMMAPDHQGMIVEEICDAVRLPWDKKKPSRGFMREYLRMKFHTKSTLDE